MGCELFVEFAEGSGNDCDCPIFFSSLRLYVSKVVCFECIVQDGE